jgi:hypothetical protein
MGFSYYRPTVFLNIWSRENTGWIVEKIITPCWSAWWNASCHDPVQRKDNIMMRMENENLVQSLHFTIPHWLPGQTSRVEGSLIESLNRHVGLIQPVICWDWAVKTIPRVFSQDSARLPPTSAVCPSVVTWWNVGFATKSSFSRDQI